MTRKMPDTPDSAPPADERKDRLAAALRANLRRRKAQGRAQADSTQAVDKGVDAISAPETDGLSPEREL